MDFNDTVVCLTGFDDPALDGQLARAFVSGDRFDVHLFNAYRSLYAREHNFVKELLSTDEVVDLDTGEVVCETGTITYPQLERVLLMVAVFPRAYAVDVKRGTVGRKNPMKTKGAIDE